MATGEPFVLDVLTPLGFSVRCSAAYWELITTVKHPAMRGRVEDVGRTLEAPDQVRRSVRDAAVLLFYRRFAPRWVCVVVLRFENAGYVITAYPADKLKSGDLLWTR